MISHPVLRYLSHHLDMFEDEKRSVTGKENVKIQGEDRLKMMFSISSLYVIFDFGFEFQFYNGFLNTITWVMMDLVN